MEVVFVPFWNLVLVVLAALELANFSNGHEQLVLLLAVPLIGADRVVFGRPKCLNLMKRHQLKSELKIQNHVMAFESQKYLILMVYSDWIRLKKCLTDEIDVFLESAVASFFANKKSELR